MIFVKFKSNTEPLPWSTRLLVFLGGVIMFAFLFFFAFTFFIIALVAVGVAVIAQFILGKPNITEEKPKVRVYHSNRRDDDVIDI